MQTNNIDYKNAISTLTSQGKFHIKLGLERISAVLKLLGDPQDKLKFIHVAGTNGKGSVCAMLSTILTQAGYKTGLYTSPHLIDYTERIKINTEDISKDGFAKLFAKVIETADKNDIHLTEFEIITAMAFMYFNEQNVDIVVLETGLGGRLDATNIIKNNLLSIITSIDIDHSDRLGNTIEQIAKEKAGIIKNNSPAIIHTNNKAYKYIKSLNNIVVTNDKYQIIDKENNIFSNGKDKYELALMGTWQSDNLPLVIKTIEVLKDNQYNISDTAIKTGLKNTIHPSRMQYFKELNLIIDGAHNEAAAKKLRESLDLYFPEKKRIWLFGVLNNKDYASIIKILFKEGDSIILEDSFSENSTNQEILESLISNSQVNIKIYKTQNCTNTVHQFLKNKDTGKTLIVAGSLYLTGTVLSIIKNDKLA